MNLPKEYLARMRDQLGDTFADYLAAMALPPRAALRVNTLKIAPDVLHALLPALTPLSQAPDGFAVPDGFRPGRDPLHAAGLYYMQEASAQSPARLPAIEPGMAVLDLCAAPGGKSTQLAARLQRTGMLLANEYVPSRANVLVGNLERLGVTNAIVTNMDTHSLCDRLRERFDVVLCDVPCAGEGMFRKDTRAIEEWSPEHVAACALRARGILDDAATALKPGGQLVYSTCSFSPAEDDDAVAQFLDRHPDFSLVLQQTLYPHTSEGEGQFMALLERNGIRTPSPFITGRSDRCAPWEAFCSDCAVPDGRVLRLRDGRVLLVPPLPFAPDGLRVVRAGLLLGEDKGNRFEPAHALAMANGLKRTVPLTEEEALRYLGGETIDRAVPKGWYAATYHGFSLGLIKSDGAMLKNHYPKGLRML